MDNLIKEFIELNIKNNILDNKNEIRYEKVEEINDKEIDILCDKLKEFNITSKEDVKKVINNYFQILQTKKHCNQKYKMTIPKWIY